MKVGIIGLGKLGLPVALAIDSKGHEVYGYDVNPDVKEYLYDRKIPFKEEGIQPLLDKHNITFCKSAEDVVSESELIFLPVQTPHAPQFEGATRLPAERADFDYSYLVKAVRNVCAAAKKNKKQVTLVVISTCLPGTYEREIKPLLNSYVNYIYNPFFIAMGTVLADFLNPEFVLIGTDQEDTDLVKGFYETIHHKQCFITDITTAEGIKVFYNTFITTKTVLANLYGEMAHKLGMNVDDIYAALSLATDRLISPKYLKAGMGDGGGCHPRDNIALSHIARHVGLSHNIFEDLMRAREAHTEWLAAMTVVHHAHLQLPIFILGKAFKPKTNIQAGSPAILMANMLKEESVPFTHIGEGEEIPQEIGVYFIATQHAEYKDIEFEPGSVVIDPFGYIENQVGVQVVRIGRP